LGSRGRTSQDWDIQVCVVNLLRSLGVFPSAVVGHSSGEIAGAYAANAITADEAIIISYYRGLATSSCKRSGGMAAVGMGRAEVGLYLRRGVVIVSSVRRITSNCFHFVRNWITWNFKLFKFWHKYRISLIELCNAELT